MKAKIYYLTLVMIFGANIVSGQITLNYFTGNQSAMNIDLSWRSTTELNMDFYSIERSLDSINYTLVQHINAGGNSSTPITYSYTDIFSFADTCYYYRLKATQFDGQYQYFDTIKICYTSPLVSIADLPLNLFSNVYPNPVTHGHLNIELKENEIYTLIIFNQIGQNVLLTETNMIKTIINCNKFDSGLYYLRLVSNNGQSSTVSFIIE